MRRQQGTSVIAAAVGRKWYGPWRDELARRWRIIDGSAASQVLKEIRRAGARVVVIIFLPDGHSFELLELLCGPPHRTRVVAVATVHSDRFERDVRAAGAACYIPLVRELSPVFRAVKELTDRLGEPSMAGPAVRRIEKVARMSSFPPPLMTRGRRA